MYWGIKGFVFGEGAAPLISFAVSKDPDKLIHNYSFLLFPIDGSAAGAFQYNIGIKRISIGAFAGGPLTDLQDMAVGIGLGYYF